MLSTEAAPCFDVVVAGGGLVGSAVAAAFLRSNALKERSVLVLEAAKAKPPKSNSETALLGAYSNRVIAINRSTRALFEKLGAWEGIRTKRFQAVKGMHVWDPTGATVAFDDEGRDIFYIVENDLVVEEMNAAVVRAGGGNIQTWHEAGVTSLKYEPGAELTRIALKRPAGATEIHSKLLIGADGANSTVRKSFKETQYISRNYDQMGVVATLHFAHKIANEVAWQKFLPTGPIAILPLSDHCSSLVWTLPTIQAQQLLKVSPEEFLLALLKGLGKPPRRDGAPFPEIRSVENRAGFPLGLGHSSRYCAPGAVLVGDSAHRVHPLAGQGVNLGFGDVECLTRCLEQNVLNGDKFAAYPYLQEYETIRQRHNVPMLLGIDGLQRLYCTDNPIVSAVRSLGIGVVNTSPTLKKLIADFAA